jgi:hypothetical protein
MLINILLQNEPENVLFVTLKIFLNSRSRGIITIVLTSEKILGCDEEQYLPVIFQTESIRR